MKRVAIAVVTAAILLPRAAAESNVIPSGTEVAVRTNESIDSKTAQAGQMFSAVVERDVTGASGSVLIPKGAGAQLVIRRISGGGTVTSAEMALDLESVTIDGRRYAVSTSELERSNRRGIGKNRRTAEMLGGGAALGTVIGAVAGGGKGAVIGAITGAAAGGAVQVLTKGKEVRVPAETVLTFRLAQPLQMGSS